MIQRDFNLLRNFSFDRRRKRSLVINKIYDYSSALYDIWHLRKVKAKFTIQMRLERLAFVTISKEWNGQLSSILRWTLQTWSWNDSSPQLLTQFALARFKAERSRTFNFNVNSRSRLSLSIANIKFSWHFFLLATHKLLLFFTYCPLELEALLRENFHIQDDLQWATQLACLTFQQLRYHCVRHSKSTLFQWATSLDLKLQTEQ